jgi:hypothetical protein
MHYLELSEHSFEHFYDTFIIYLKHLIFFHNLYNCVEQQDQILMNNYISIIKN